MAELNWKLPTKPDQTLPPAIPKEAVGRSMLPEPLGRKPSELLKWTLPKEKLDWTIPKDPFYPKFVETLKRLQAGARGTAKELVETGQSAVVGDFDQEFDAITRFKKALKGEEYVTAEQVFESIPNAQTKSMLLNMALNLPKEAFETSLDFITDPTVYLMYAGGKALKSIYHIGKIVGLGKPIGRAVEALRKTPVGKKVIEWLVYRGGQPPPYQKIAEQRLANIRKGHEIAEKTGALLSKGLSKAEQQRVGQIFKGGVSVSKTEQPFRRMAGKARFRLTKVSKQAVEQGLLSEEKFAENIKTYMPRLYTKWEKKGAGRGIAEFLGIKPTRIKGKRFLRRQDIPAEVRALMGEIKEPAYPVAKGIAQITHDVETSKLFNKVAQNPEWVSDVARPGFVQLAKTKGVGDLAGKWIAEPIAKDVNEITAVPGAVTKLYNSLLGYWKYSKTVANPATHFRNVISNTILLDISGIDHTQQMTLLPRAGKEILKKGRYYKEARKAGLLGHEFFGGEIKAFTDNYKGASHLDSVVNAIKPIKWLGRKAGRVYQGEEQIFKLAKFISERDKGRTVELAVKEAEKWLFNYEKVPKAINFLRRSPIGAPFITFASKALPRAVETAITNPLQIGKYAIMMKAIENRTKADLGISDEELRAIKENRRGIHLVLPARDKAGLIQTLDVSYILPWGDIGETGGVFGLSPSISPSNPLPKTIAELAFNKSLYTGREIFKNTDTGTEKAGKIADYLGKNLIPLPTWVPPGYSWHKFMSAIEKRPDYYGRVRGLPKVLADILVGIKISPIDLGQIFQREENQKKFTERELNRDLAFTLKHPGISIKEKQDKARVHGEKIRRLYEDRRELNTLFRLLAGGGI
jgi:hypothetical protein